MPTLARMIQDQIRPRGRTDEEHARIVEETARPGSLSDRRRAAHPLSNQGDSYDHGQPQPSMKSAVPYMSPRVTITPIHPLRPAMRSWLLNSLLAKCSGPDR